MEKRRVREDRREHLAGTLSPSGTPVGTRNSVEGAKSFGNFSICLVMASLIFFPFSVLARDPYRAIAKKLSGVTQQRPLLKVAVVPFSYPQDLDSSLGKRVADRLTTSLVELGKVEVLERALLDEVMKEYQLMHSGISNPQMVKKIGSILPVDALICGSLFLLDGSIEAHARMIDVETGRVLRVAKTRLAPEWSEPDLDKWIQVQMRRLAEDMEEPTKVYAVAVASRTATASLLELSRK